MTCEKVTAEDFQTQTCVSLDSVCPFDPFPCPCPFCPSHDLSPSPCLSPSPSPSPCPSPSLCLYLDSGGGRDLFAEKESACCSCRSLFGNGSGLGCHSEEGCESVGEETCVRKCMKHTILECTHTHTHTHTHTYNALIYTYNVHDIVHVRMHHNT